MHRLIWALCFLYFSSVLSHQKDLTTINNSYLLNASQKFHVLYNKKQYDIAELCEQKNMPKRFEVDNGQVWEITDISQSGQPQYDITFNFNAARSVSADHLWSGGLSGYNLSGQGIILGLWDAGKVLASHQEFENRVLLLDNASGLNSHSTHVAATMIAAGLQSNARGMSNRAQLHAYDWNDELAELSQEAADGLLIANHSYGRLRGWHYYSSGNIHWTWYGDPSIDQSEDYRFGFYSTLTSDLDEVAYHSPHLLIVKSVGNDRNDSGPVEGEEHYVWQNGSWQTSTYSRQKDGGEYGYDCIGERAVAKNILTVGAVSDIPSGYAHPSDVVMSTFSAWGPTDDGRIKPDIVANGISLYSCSSENNSSYAYKSGTSMAAPNVSGSLALLAELYDTLSGGDKMLASTLKALVIHTADEAGPDDGPDYTFGWGLLNADRAAKVIDENFTGHLASITENALMNNQSQTFNYYATGQEPLIFTLCWSDPPGVSPEPALNPRDKMLVNDLDIRVQNSMSTFSPWKLDPLSPSSPAVFGDNTLDNVEKIVVKNPQSGLYTVTINHKGVLQGQQYYSLLVSGAEKSEFSQNIHFEPGWNIFSLAIIPENFDLLDILSPILSDAAKVMDEDGKSIEMLLGKWKNYIGDWQSTEGYYIRMNDYADLDINGAKISTPLSIPLFSGWNIISYPCLFTEQDALLVVQDLIENNVLEKIADEDGNAVDNLFGHWKNYIGNFKAGEGYYVKLNSDWMLNMMCNENSAIAKPEQQQYSEPQHFTADTNENPFMPMSLYITQAQIDGCNLDDGDEIALFSQDNCIAAKKWDHNYSFDNPLLIPLSTECENRSGFNDDEEIIFKIWQNSKNKEITLPANGVSIYISRQKVEQKPVMFKSMESTIVTLVYSESREKALSSFYLYPNFPNPFNSSTTISFDLPYHEFVEVNIYDINGHLVKTLIKNFRNSGHYDIVWDGTNNREGHVASGVYFCSLKAGSFCLTKKMFLAK